MEAGPPQRRLLARHNDPTGGPVAHAACHGAGGGGATQTARKSGAPGRPLPRRPANVRWCEGPVPRPPPPPGQSNLGPRARGRTIGHQHLRICVGRGRGLPGQTGPVPKASPPAGHRYGTRPVALQHRRGAATLPVQPCPLTADIVAAVKGGNIRACHAPALLPFIARPGNLSDYGPHTPGASKRLCSAL